MPYANNHGVRIHYEVEGVGPPLILQHGFSDSLETWYTFGYVSALKEKHRLILVDARGHGGSDKPHEVESYHPDVIAADYVSILDDLGIETSAYWGYSMGANFGFKCIARYALSRFSSMILGAGFPYADLTEEDRENTVSYVNAIAEAAEKGAEAWVAFMERGGFRLPAQVRAKQLRNDPKAFFAYVKAAATELWPSSADILPRIDIPCLVYAGGFDDASANLQHAVKAMPRATFFIVPGLDHLMAYLRSDLVLPHVARFLAEVERR
jgi:pimeloyl-ACP methyl ester carboxylesterase